MDCANEGATGVKQNIIIDIAYCGGVGWTGIAKKLCDRIQQRLPRATIDCRPETNFTGNLEATLIIDRREKRKVYKGDKEETVSKLEEIAQKVVEAYTAA